MPRFSDAVILHPVGDDANGRKVELAPGAAAAWSAMMRAGMEDGVRLLLLSGFRSFERQAEIVSRKLAQGQTLASILRVNAYPGFSEHHTGQAVDIGSADSEPFTEKFEQTAEFAWLTARAVEFGFSLSYPRNNSYALEHEPWHWCWHSPASATTGAV